MAKFIKIENGYVNIDQIVCMSYVKDADSTVIIFPKSGDETVVAKGDITSDILNKNNDVGMREKLICRCLVDMLRSYFTNIQTRLDMIARSKR